jgi:beta-galactosidase/beta-glucuronidase
MGKAMRTDKTVLIFLPALLAIFLLSTLSSPLFSQDTETLYLSGTDSEHPIDWKFSCSDGRQSGFWTFIPVPSNWELHGFGTYNYGHDQPKADETGKYRHTFKLPPNWSEKRIYLVFEASMTDTEAWINGKSVGPRHQGGFYEFQYDVTDLVRFSAANQLEVTVHKVSSDPSVNSAERDADYWVFGGIYRPVLLRAFPKQHILRTAIDARADGKLEIHAELEGTDSEITLEGQVQTLDGKQIGETFSVGVPAGKSHATLSNSISGHKPWTAETPNLNQVVLSLRRGDQVLHTTSERFGFRTFEVRPRDGLYLNGQKIKLKGVNRHSFWPTSGRATSVRQSLSDVQLIKSMNMNSVRMSHYPPDKHFLDACDSLGLYVLDELGGWQKPPYDTAIGKKLVREL